MYKRESIADGNCRSHIYNYPDNNCSLNELPPSHSCNSRRPSTIFRDFSFFIAHKISQSMSHPHVPTVLANSAVLVPSRKFKEFPARKPSRSYFKNKCLGRSVRQQTNGKVKLLDEGQFLRAQSTHIRKRNQQEYYLQLGQSHLASPSMVSSEQEPSQTLNNQVDNLQFTHCIQPPPYRRTLNVRKHKQSFASPFTISLFRSSIPQQPQILVLPQDIIQPSICIRTKEKQERDKFNLNKTMCQKDALSSRKQKPKDTNVSGKETLRQGSFSANKLTKRKQDNSKSRGVRQDEEFDVRPWGNGEEKENQVYF